MATPVRGRPKFSGSRPAASGARRWPPAVAQVRPDECRRALGQRDLCRRRAASDLTRAGRHPGVQTNICWRCSAPRPSARRPNRRDNLPFMRGWTGFPRGSVALSDVTLRPRTGINFGRTPKRALHRTGTASKFRTMSEFVRPFPEGDHRIAFPSVHWSLAAWRANPDGPLGAPAGNPAGDLRGSRELSAYVAMMGPAQ